MAGLVLPTAGQPGWDITLNNALLFLFNSISSNGAFTRTAVSNVDYTAQLLDRFIAYTSLTAGHTVTLPDAATLVDTIVVVKDESGTAGTNNITVKSANIAQTIDGGATSVINSNYAAKRYYSNGTQWFTA